MALNAVHIRARSALSDPRLGIGFRTSDQNPDRYTYSDDWSTLRTGEPSNASVRTAPTFVKQTALSNPALAQYHTEELPLPWVEPASGNSSSSFSQFYANLAREDPQLATAREAAPDHAHLRLAQPRAVQHPHHHRHDPTARHKADWFVSRALAKLRHSQLSEKGKQKEVCDLEPSTTLCPSCGDALPADRTPEAMAQHRQSITHRLGLNAPMSSASASEAPSAAPSEAPTPLYRSRSASPDLRIAQGPQPRSVSRRRLSTAARWKKIHHDNVGYTLLSRMGWKEGMGLGVDEWKWQQMFKEKKRQKLNHIRALLRQSGAVHGDTVDEAVVMSDESSPTSEWLQMLPQAPAEMMDDYRFGDDALLLTDDDMHNLIIESLPLEERLALQHAIQAGIIRLQDLVVSTPQQTHNGVLVEPIQVQVRPDRSGLGLESHRRRSRTADGAVEIRNPAHQDEALCKKTRTSTNPSQYLRPRSKSTKHQRKLAEERKKRDWLDLRASLS